MIFPVILQILINFKMLSMGGHLQNMNTYKLTIAISRNYVNVSISIIIISIIIIMQLVLNVQKTTSC